MKIPALRLLALACALAAVGAARARRSGLRGLRHSGVASQSERSIGVSIGVSVGADNGAGGGNGAVGGAIGGAASLEAALGTMVVQMLQGQGTTVRDIVHAASSRMDLPDAIRRLEGRLPDDVTALMHIAGTLDETKANVTAGAKHDVMADAKVRGVLSEENLQKARIILNGMIEQAWKELDAVVIGCKQFGESNREAFGVVTKDLSRLGSEIADLSRKKVSASEDMQVQDSMIAQSKTTVEAEMQEHAKSVSDKKAEMAKRRNDLAVFKFILEFTSCAPAFVQLNGSVPDPSSMEVCDTNEGLILRFDNPALQARLERMMSREARDAVREALGEARLGYVGLLQQPDNASEPVTPAPSVAPVQTAPDKSVQWKKCTASKPNCGVLHDTMSIQWGKFKDAVDELQAEIQKDNDDFTAEKASMNEQLSTNKNIKTGDMQMLAETVSALNADTIESNEKSEQYRHLESVYKWKTKDCKAKVEEILFTDMCAVKKVRNGILTASKASPPSAVTDCDVGEFVAGPCDKDCDDTCPQKDPMACGGTQTLKREKVVSPNEYGVQCPVLETMKKCNQVKCAADCVMSDWSGWTQCTKECGSGLQSRTRSILTKPGNGGEECDSVQEARDCNTGSCDQDCKLGGWSDWSSCTVVCGGGTRHRTASVLLPIKAGGKCPKPHHHDRYDREACNTQACIGDEVCIAQQDLILAIDGSGSLKAEGFAIVRDFASKLVSKYLNMYAGKEAMRVGVLLFGNGHVKPDDTITQAINVQPLTADLALVKKKIEELKWQRGLTNMAQAFALTDLMLQGGRTSAQSAVLMLSDGKYSFKFLTAEKVRELKDRNVQIFMAPIADWSSEELKTLRKWASEPWETNFERIPGLGALKQNMGSFASALIAKFCPNSISPSAQAKNSELNEYMLVHAGGLAAAECGAAQDLGVKTFADCAFAARDAEALSFAVGISGSEVGKCRVEGMKVTIELWQDWKVNRTDPACPCGEWQPNPDFDTYALKPPPE